MLSMIASIISSASFRSSSLVLPRNLAVIWSLASRESLPFSTDFASCFLIPSRPFVSNWSETSTTVTSRSACAQTCAMPEPINPQPSTPTLFIFMRRDLQCLVDRQTVSATKLYQLGCRNPPARLYSDGCFLNLDGCVRFNDDKTTSRSGLTRLTRFAENLLNHRGPVAHITSDHERSNENS